LSDGWPLNCLRDLGKMMIMEWEKGKEGAKSAAL
jgi:hypothetical protein